ncbi:MAG: c-type cytochrome [Neomegalonema sp.]|nr:c-type cytochrome [Neomegalonema sp.]
MSRFLNGVTLAATIGLLAFTAQAEPKLGLGRAATPDEVAAWDIDIRPDGQGLPEGRGTVAEGEEIFAEQCAVCHGDFGEGVDRWPVLAGGQGTLSSHDPVKTIGSYWPYLSTVWDYVHRAMPFGNAQSLTNDQVYAITAYLLYVNDVVTEDDFELSKDNFTEVRLPNEANFFMDDRLETERPSPAEVCMTNCKPDVKITKRATVIDVTPEGEGDEEASAEGSMEAETEMAQADPAPAPAPAAVAPAVVAIDADLAAKGEKVFKKCKSCHQVGEGAKNKIGPILTDIVGGPVGGVADFKYSDIFQEKAAEGVVWTMENLDAYLTKPKDWAPKTKMSFNGLRKEKDRAAVIEYLKAASQ